MNAIAARPEAPVARNDRSPGTIRRGQPAGMLLVDPDGSLPRGVLAGVASRADLGPPVCATEPDGALRLATEHDPPVVIACWFEGLPELLEALDEQGRHAGDPFHVVIVATEDRLAHETAVERCDRFAVTCVPRDRLIEHLIVRLAERASHYRGRTDNLC